MNRHFVRKVSYLQKTGGTYWKPIQSGTPRDRERVQQMTGLDDSHFFNEQICLTQPLSPHEAAAFDNVRIALSDIKLPKQIVHYPLIIEGAGGLLVPLNEKEMMVDLFCHLNLPIILVARSTLGTINHTLLSLECARKRNLEVLGVVLVGPNHPENERAIAQFGKVSILEKISLPHGE